MRFLQALWECSILLPNFGGPVRNFQKFFKSFADASKFIDFIRRAPTAANFTQNVTDTQTAIKQIGVFVAFILQPEMKPPKRVPARTINTERDESSQTHLTVFTTLRSFRDKVFFTVGGDTDRCMR